MTGGNGGRLGFAGPSLLAMTLALASGTAAAQGWRTLDPVQIAQAEPVQIAQAQPVQIAQAGPAQQQRMWSFALGAFLYYDAFESDDDLIKSDQLSEYFTFSGTRGNVFSQGDSLSLWAKFGFVQAWPERGGVEDSAYATPTDILVGASYSTWDKKTSGFTADVFMNIPTGPSNFSLAELAAIPNPKVVSVPVLSEGFQIGTEVQYHRQIDRWHVHGGLGYTFRSGISEFDQFEVDELSGGHDVSVLAGADYQIHERLNLGVNVLYTHSFEEEGSENDFVSVSVPLTYLFERGEASLTYTFSYSSGENRELTRLRREEDALTFLDGLRHTIGIDVGYKVLEPLVVRGFVEGSIGNGGRSDDPAFFTTDDYIQLGLGATYTLAQNISVQGLVKYFDVSTKGADGGSTTFEGVSAMLGLKYGF